MTGLWLARVALASEPQPLAIDIERFRPAHAPAAYVRAEGVEPTPPGAFAFAAWVHHAHDPLVWFRDGERVVAPSGADALIRSRTRLELLGSYGLGRGISVGASLPFTGWQVGFEPSAPGPTAALIDPAPAGLGDLRLHGRAVLWGEGGPVALGARAELGLPTGSRRSFLGDGAPSLAPSLVAEVVDRADAPRLRAALNLGADLRRPARFGDLRLGSALTWAVAAAVAPVAAVQVGLDLAGRWAGPRRAQRSTELSPFLRVLPGRLTQVTVGAGVGLDAGVGTPAWRVFSGVAFVPPRDRPRPAEVRPPPPRPTGPAAVPDRDGDQIPDDRDACPLAPEDRDGFQDEDGCPDPDNDGDGILDGMDACPLDPETYNGFQDGDGCPDVVPRVVVQPGRLALSETVHFQTDRAVLKRASLPLLDEVARVLQAHPEITRLRVEGHTDSEGPAIYNRQLSEVRARAVVEHLVARGVAVERLEYAGVGEDQPLQSNATEAGRAANRRVEFVIIATAARPPG